MPLFPMMHNSTNPQASAEQGQFVTLFLANQHRIYGFVVSVVPQWVEAEEIFQQTCLTLWERWADFDADGDFVRWACGIAIGHLRNYLRKKQNHQVLFDVGVMEQLAATQIEQNSRLEELQHALRDCVRKLPAVFQRLVVSSYSGNCSLREVADREGKPLNVIYKQLRKIRALLYDCVHRTLAKWQAS